MNGNRFICMAFTAALASWQAGSLAAETTPSPSAAIVKQLFDNEQTGVPGKELLMLTVEYLPGGASLPHRHDAQVFVYVLEGQHQDAGRRRSHRHAAPRPDLLREPDRHSRRFGQCQQDQTRQVSGVHRQGQGRTGNARSRARRNAVKILATLSKRFAGLLLAIYLAPRGPK
jgi:hypothetical protein